MVQARNILVAGGTGFVGRHLVNLLRSGGAKVRVITRNPGSKPDHLSWSQIKSSGLPKDTTDVVNLAGRNIFDPSLWTQSFKREIYDSRIETNKTLAVAIHAANTKPNSFVTISGVGYYPPNESLEYDENWSHPESGKQTSGSFLENLARDWEAASILNEELAQPTRRVVIRAGVVLGKDGGVIKNLSLPFSLGLGGPIGDGSQWFPWIHVTDLANMIKFSIVNEHVTGVINGVAPQQATNREFAKTLASALNRPAILPAPAFAMKLLFGSERGDVLIKGQRVKSRASLLGFRYEYPSLSEACKQVVAR